MSSNSSMKGLHPLKGPDFPSPKGLGSSPEGLPSRHRLPLSEDDHLRADLDPVVEVDHVLVEHADAARRYRVADRVRLVRAVDAVERGAEIHDARAELVL